MEEPKMETIIAAAITAGVTLAVCLITNHAQAEKTRALLDYRLGQLEKKQDKHNNLVERTFFLEGQMRECIHDIRDLKAYHKPVSEE
jgi:hypothetical protein